MSYSVQLIRKVNQVTSSWSGGETTQLVIYPPDADYQQRNFIWRISSAKVNVNESVFTQLPRIHRLIMVLEGKLTLQHEGHHSVVLHPFDQDRFSGDWTTRSVGRATDFNLMCAEGCVGELHAIHLTSAGETTIVPPSVTDSCSESCADAFYNVAGTHVMAVVNGDQTHVLQAGDLLLMFRESMDAQIGVRICNEGEAKAGLVHAHIRY